MNTTPTHRPGPADLKRRRTIFYIAASAFIVVALVLIVVLVIEIRARVRDEVETRLQNSAQTQQEGSTDGTLAQNGETSGDASANTSGETSAEGSDQNSGESSAESSSESSSDSSGETSAARLFATKTEQMSEDEIHMGILQLVNKQHEYLFLDDWLIYMADLDTRWGYALNDYDIQMAEPAAYAIDSFLNDFCEETGSWDLYMMNGFRSAEEADWLFNRSAEQNGYEHALMYVMRAGFSEHHTGLASDFGLFSGVYFDAENDDRNNWI